MEQDFSALHRDWEKVGGYMLAALQDVAMNLGGEELVAQVNENAATNKVLPDLKALQLLEGLHPGSAEQVITRMSGIQDEAHEREITELRRPNARKYGKALLDGFTSLGSIKVQPRKFR